MIVTYNSYIILIRNLRKDMNDNLQQVKEITITDFASSMQIYFCTMFTNNWPFDLLYNFPKLLFFFLPSAALYKSRKIFMLTLQGLGSRQLNREIAFWVCSSFYYIHIQENFHLFQIAEKKDQKSYTFIQIYKLVQSPWQGKFCGVTFNLRTEMLPCRVTWITELCLLIA